MTIYPTLKVEIAFIANPYDTAPTWTDVTAYVRGSVSSKRGRNYELSRTEAGTISLTLENVDGRFSPFSTTSPYYPYVLPYRPIRVTASDGTTTFSIFRGHVERWPQKWSGAGNYGTVAITAVDAFKTVLARTFGRRYFEQVNADVPTWFFSDMATNTGSSSGVSIVNVDALQGSTDGATFTLVTGPTGGDGGVKITHGTAANYPDGTSTGTGISHIRNSTGGGRNSGSTVVEEVWWRPDSVPAVNGYFVKVIGPHVWTTNTGATQSEVSVEARFDAAGATYQLRYWGNTNPLGTGTVIAGATTVRPTAGRWDHVAVRQVYTSSANKTYELYVNGVLLASGTQTSNAYLATSSGYLGGAANVPAGFACSWSEWATYTNGDGGNTSVVGIQGRAAYVSTYGEFGVQDAGARIGAVLDSIGWPSALRNLDTGASSLTATGSLNGRTALDVIQSAADDELGNVYIDGQGRVVFDNRAARNSPTAVAIAGETYPNLLTANAASVETDATAWPALINATVARSTAQALVGSASLRITSTASGTAWAQTPGGTSGYAISPNTQYTAVGSFRAATVARSCQVVIIWYNAAGTQLTFPSASATDTTTGFTQVALTATSPATAAFAAIALTVAGTAAGEQHYADCVALSPGSSTFWTPGGSSAEIPYLEGIEIEYDDEKIANRVEVTQSGSSPTYVSIATDTTSQASYGARSLPRSASLVSTADCDGMAATLLARYKDPIGRLPTLQFDLKAQPRAIAKVLGLEIGQLVTAKRRPQGAPEISLDVWVDGIEDSVDESKWVRTLRLTPKFPNSTY